MDKDKQNIEIIEGSWEWDVPARGDESRVPNRYRSEPETDEAGIVKGTDMLGVAVASFAVLLAVAGTLAGIVLRIAE